MGDIADLPSPVLDRMDAALVLVKQRDGAEPPVLPGAAMDQEVHLERLGVERLFHPRTR